jgi:NADPH-dependent 2,4-dienoyl-CoA reductase/sulfur reductase-like enzyme/nitrite reductase/ring-hydroxylating ferredoxin subunit
MSTPNGTTRGPDFSHGIECASLEDGRILAGHVDGTLALLVRRGYEFFAIGASCTHYGGPLCDGLLVGEAIRCPWHHAEFDIRNGEVTRAPAIDRLPCWTVEIRDGFVYAGKRLEPVRDARPSKAAQAAAPASVVIIGGGSAGFSAADTLRREGYEGPVTLISADASLPCDRPNLSKGYLAGTAPEDWLLLRPAEFYRDHHIEVRLNARVARIDVQGRKIELDDRSAYDFDALLLATGSEPVRLRIPGADLPHVHYLRTLADSRALVASAQKSTRAAVIGASFIGLEVAASLRARGLEVDVIGREAVPMEQVLGPEVGTFLRQLHESHGVRFHLGSTPSSIDGQAVTLDTGERLDADLVVVGIGVRPAVALAEAAGLTVDRGVVVDRYLETSVPGIFAAGDIARWPDPLTGQPVRIEHFVVAERQGQTAARNILGRREAFEGVPFFWTEQYDLGIAHIGHAEEWDETTIDGDLEARDCSITFRQAGRKLAVAVIHRDHEGLRAEAQFERGIAQASKLAGCAAAPEPEPA